jgi:SAM-dependent methyltransferase
MSNPEEFDATTRDDVTDTGVFHAVRDGYDAAYDVLPQAATFNRLWRQHAYGGDFPEDYAHIGFLTMPEARRFLELLAIPTDGVLVDLACGTGGPGLWIASESGASLIGVDPAPAGLNAARRRAEQVGLAGRSRFEQGTFEQTGLADQEADAVMSIEAFQYAPDKRAALAEFARILRPGRRVGFICFEVDPDLAHGVPVLGVDPIPDYRPLLEATGLTVETYEETPGWEPRVYDAFGALIDHADELTAEMGERAVEGALAEAMLTVSVKPYPRRVLAVASRPS